MTDSQRAKSPLPARIGPYEVVRELGRGAMGVVFLARQTGLKREVAVKVLAGSRQASEVSRERFRREAKLIARLHHPNVIGVHDAGEDQGRFWYSMDVVSGETLDDAVRKRGPFEPRQACALVRDVALAVHALHEAGIVHRDLKPANVLLEATSGRPLLTDFGLALDLASDDAHRLTKTGVAVGTPLYMAPEQVRGERGVDRRADVYALGMILYFLLAGEEAFACETIEQLVTAILGVAPRAPSKAKADVPRAVDALVLRALAKDRDERFATARELAEALDAFLKPRPAAPAAAPALRSRLWLVLLPTLAALGFAVPTLLQSLEIRAVRERDEELEARARALAAELVRKNDRAAAEAFAEARDRLGRRDVRPAREAARRARELRPRDPRIEALEARAMLLDAEMQGSRGTKLADEARAIAQRALAAAPEDAFVLVTAAHARFDQGDKARGVELIEAATVLARHPDPEDLVDAADAYLWCVGPDRAEAALDLASRAIAARPGVARAHAVRSRAFIYLDRRGEALADLDRVVQLAPRDARFRIERSVVRSEAGNVAGAREDLDVAIELEPGSRTYRGQRGLLLERAGKDKEALADYDAALDGTPEETARVWPVRYRRGRLRAKGPDLEGALADLELAVAQAPGADEQMLFALGGVLVKLGRYPRAHEVLEKAIESQPEQSEPVLRLGACYEKEGVPEQARVLYAHARIRLEGPERAAVEAALRAVDRRIREGEGAAIDARIDACKKRLDDLSSEIVAVGELPESPDKTARLSALKKKVKDVQEEIDTIARLRKAQER